MATQKQTTVDWPVEFRRLAENSRNPHLQNFYRAGIADSQTPIEDVPMVALDFETTGLDSERDEIVSIGLVPFDTRRIYCRQAEHWIVNPARALTENSVVIHQITHSDINQAPDLQSILDSVLDALAGKIIVVHYRRIEREFLAKALMRRINEGINFPVIDTMEIEQQALQQKRGLVGKLLHQPLGSVRLPDCRQRYNLPVYQLHHAMIDALATAELLQAQLTHHYPPAVTVGELWS